MPSGHPLSPLNPIDSMKTSEDNPNRFMSLWLSKLLHSQLSAIAAKKNLNVSELIREILNAYVKKYNNPY